MKVPPINLVFEPVSLCPLQCCSCPTGRRELKRGNGMLMPDKLSEMLRILSSQAKINHIALLNWGEPLMCPHLPELVRISKRFGRTYLSTTGNYVRCDLQELVKAEPDVFIVATSGFTQEVYETTHAGGKTDNFFSFCFKLRAMKARNVAVCFHRYSNNINEEPFVRDFARRLGFRFNSNWAYHAPVEAIIRGESNQWQVVPSPDQLAIAKAQKDYLCGFQTSELAINSDGGLRGCPSAADQTVLGNVLTDSLEDSAGTKEEVLAL